MNHYKYNHKTSHKLFGVRSSASLREASDEERVLFSGVRAVVWLMFNYEWRRESPLLRFVMLNGAGRASFTFSSRNNNKDEDGRWESNERKKKRIEYATILSWQRCHPDLASAVAHVDKVNDENQTEKKNRIEIKWTWVVSIGKMCKGMRDGHCRDDAHRHHHAAVVATY